MLEQLGTELKTLIGSNLMQAFKRLEETLRAEMPLSDKLMAQQSRFNIITQDKNAGQVTDEVYRVELTNISNALKDIVNAITDDDLRSGLSELGRQIELLDLSEPLGVLSLVDCDRIAPRDFFWNEFGERAGQPYQFYFLPSSPTQQPDGFAERLVWEIIQFELQDEENAIWFERDTRNSMSRVKISKLPVGPTVSFSINQFKKYFKGHFPQGETEIEAWLDNSAAALQYRYIVFVFRIDVRLGLTKSLLEYFEWFITTFSTMDESKPAFVFFFLLDKPDFDKNVDTKMLEELKTLTDKYEKATEIIPHLTPLSLDDVRTWFRDKGARDEAQLEILIKLFARRYQLNVNDATATNVDMLYTQELQKIAFDVVNKVKV